ncbi:unnamed protein product [Sphenostylis stenocarpa]|uniref:G protein gamma domain-containing protein n=1 Tax=Sphenostylis stenocarpa TaxID=92480 RepID=A0AA86W112_9FABA|nr:unnamed protein product [Sphenostylis stenocarpa]
MQSGGPESASPMTHRVQSLSSADTRGKHRIHAEVKRLEQEARFLEIGAQDDIDVRVVGVDREIGYEISLDVKFLLGILFERCDEARRGMVGKGADKAEELEQLERMEKASTACKGMLSNVETKPDPLLPSTIGPVSPTWDRWFEGPQDSKGCCRCWIL